MILDGSHRKWCVATLILFLLATAGYVLYALRSPGGPRGGSIVGMLYGIAGSALMVFAGLISLRKKVPTWRVGSAQSWLRGHIWLGLLSVPLILFHAGFHWGGALEQVLLVVMGGVILSGLIDLGVQQFFPREMTARVPLETFYAQIPFECRLLQLEGDVAVATICGPLPLEADQNVATASRLKALGVTGRQPLPSVYRSSESKNGQPAEAPPSKAAGKAGTPSAPAGPAAAPEKKLSPAEKIAAMRAAKAVASGAETPPSDESAPAETQKNPPASKMTAAEKIAAMRSAKATIAATTAEPNQPAQDKAPLSPADKIALMRSLKHSSKPVATETPAEPAAAAEPATPGEQRAATVPSSDSPIDTAAAGGEGKQPLTAAEKIALMRAGKKPATAPPSSAEAASPREAVATAKPLTAAEKIAMMRAGKKPAAEPSAATETAPSTVATSLAVEAAAGDQAKTPLTAAEKIAMMRAKGKAAVPPAEKGEAKPTPPTTPKKPAAAAKARAEKPVDPVAQKRAAEGLQKFYVESVRPFLAHESRARGALASEVNAGGVFAAVGAGLPDDVRPVLDRLLALCEKRRQLTVQERIHGALHFWLFIHVPLSLALLGLGVAHAIMSVYY